MITGGKRQGLLLCLFTVRSKATKQHSSGSAVCSTLCRILTRVRYWRKKTQAALILTYTCTKVAREIRLWSSSPSYAALRG